MTKSRLTHRMYTNVIVLLLLFRTVFANTENIRFVSSLASYEHHEIEGVLSDREGLDRLRVKLDDMPSPGQYKTKWFSIDAIPEKSYEVRVCWPASSPTEFKLSYEDGHVGVTYGPEFFSSNSTLMEHPNDMDMIIVLNKVVLFLPQDIIETIALAIAAAFIGLWGGRLAMRSLK